MIPKGSYAIMAQRHEIGDGLDDFPTPPWATRALIKYVLNSTLSNKSVLGGRGYMAETLADYFENVYAADIHDYGYEKANVKDFLSDDFYCHPPQWVITNPPFNKAEGFISKSLGLATDGVAMFCRGNFTESIGRYNRLFSQTPPTIFAPFAERVPLVKGRLDSKIKSATAYAWFVWEKNPQKNTSLVWIPPCRKLLEKDSDYE